MSSSLPTGTVTFLFTDIEGSALLVQQNPAEMPGLFARHNTILRQSIEAHHGYVFQIRGDAFCAAFFTASDALQAALQAQCQLQQGDWSPTVLKVRMGIHTGMAQAVRDEEEDDGYTGYLTLTRVQRVMSLAYGCQILISNASAELLQGELLEGVELRDLGEYRLKGVLNPERLWQVMAPDLLSEFPPLPSLNAIPNNLPVQLSSFIGREHEIAEVVRLLQDTRLLTLTGVGGAGKTRLSLQAAAEALDVFQDGVWLVELAPLADPALLIQSVATVLGVSEMPGYPVKVALLNYLRAKNLLLLLDNCEHLMEACAQLADLLLRECPGLRILASSREALGIAGERVLQVPSLALPDRQNSPSLEDLTRSDAVQLFFERKRACAGLGITEQNVRFIALICYRLDGIPGDRAGRSAGEDVLGRAICPNR
jgi:class 3 adenylate cyclase